MANHKAKGSIEWDFDDASKAFIFKASRDIPKSEEIRHSYCASTSHEFFLNYGAILESDERHVIKLKLSLIQDVPYYEFKEDLIS